MKESDREDLASSQSDETEKLSKKLRNDKAYGIESMEQWTTNQEEEFAQATDAGSIWLGISRNQHVPRM